MNLSEAGSLSSGAEPSFLAGAGAGVAPAPSVNKLTKLVTVTKKFINIVNLNCSFSCTKLKNFNSIFRLAE